MRKGMKRIKSAYSKLSKIRKVEVVAERKALEFLTNVYNGYDQDSSARFSIVLGDKFKFLDNPEAIPVVSDLNVFNLKTLLVKFYKRAVRV